MISALFHRGINDLQPSVISFSTAISSCEDSTAWQEALGLLSWMSAEEVRPNVLTLDADYLCLMQKDLPKYRLVTSPLNLPIVFVFLFDGKLSLKTFGDSLLYDFV